MAMPEYHMKAGVSYDTSYDAAEIKDGGVLDSDMLRRIGHDLCEFFNCFTMYGFDAHGRPIKICHTSSFLEELALQKLMEDDLIEDNGDWMKRINEEDPDDTPFD
jgi:hypothetical protein